MGSDAVLVANRGEIAVRVLRAAEEAGLRTVAVYAEDDAQAAHVRLADEAHPLPGTGPAAYLDGAAVLAAARKAGCGLLHPGYGFLSEDADFAARCTAEGIVFVGPDPEVIALFGDKGRARALAGRLGVPVLAGTDGPTSLAEAREFLTGLGPGGAVMVKAVGGGGGRGMRAVRGADELEEAWERCRSEAEQGFGRGELYVERLLAGARHIEVQVLGDTTGTVTHLWERDCSAQRRHQKLIETAPAPALCARVRDRLLDSALRMARETRYTGLGTFEFLVSGEEFHFIEANPRLQVEHTVTEEVTGVDLVAVQIHLSAGRTLASLGLGGTPAPPRGFAVQARVYAEEPGTLNRFEVPTGPGVRVDTATRTGDTTGTRYDPLLAKVIARVPEGSGFAAACERARRALGEFGVEGVRTGIPLLNAVLRDPEFVAGGTDTGFVEQLTGRLAGGQVEGWSDGPSAAPDAVTGADGTVAAPMSGTVVSVDATAGQPVGAGRQLLVVEAMKMEHVVRAERAGTVRAVLVAVGDAVFEGAPLVLLDPADGAGTVESEAAAVDLDAVRPELAEVRARHALTLDEHRPEAVAKRHRIGRRTARENIADLCDEGSFTEFGALAVAAQRQRRSLQDLIVSTPADGMVTGTGRVAGSPVVAMSYDYTVLAGTQGLQNHRKTDRMLQLAGERRLPVVLFAEGGGGRPGDTDTTSVAGLDVMTFHQMARLSGSVPLVGIASGRCFAGNAALLGCCDVVIATPEATIGMGGPAMIEGGGLGVYTPEEVGPLSVQVPNGVVDVAVADEAEAVRVARAYLSYFQGAQESWQAPDPRLLRHAVPENRRRAYDIRHVVEGFADIGSVLELRQGFGNGVITALIRVEGRPMALLASNPGHLGGAIDRDAADKAARFLKLCDAFGLPIVSLCDTPGFMVGPDAERTATVRHFARLFLAGAHLRVPLVSLILRKAYGLGAMAMMGGSTRVPLATAAWPSGELGGMGLEGAVRLGYRKELAAIEDAEARQRAFEERVAELYEHGKAVNAAAALEIDAVIDPAASREWVLAALDGHRAAAGEASRGGRVDTW
ncbi:carbamoyl-phosphate synthase large subunit [Streptomyces sp. PKU-EA00015]|uniref:acetyl-CoA carboxylase family protein n=1 Tax=Streptomyces sp. PKU-EA00015 TaxID=2748326 RepID=UPI0015A0D2BE|nr:carboxyl transferase domain-containing protein [Streptomyces sp. PKU-EA00015]NWF28691.1 carbamoyl-phosphate synthase large subunit [Streptomyces sp. PKU-EA00015]